MISTGTGSIDDMLGGGIPSGSRVIYCLEPGVDGQLLMISTLYDALRQGLPCMVIIPHVTADTYLHEAAVMNNQDWGFAAGRILFIDSADRQRIKLAAHDRESEENEWRSRIAAACAKNRAAVVFVYFDILYEDFGLEPALSLLDLPHGAETRPTVILEHLNLEGERFLDKVMAGNAFDLVISLMSSSRPMPQFSYFTILHTSWGAGVRRALPFIVRDGRIIPFIPKIVVTGPPESGKSAFVARASGEGRSVDRGGIGGTGGTTVAMDFGQMQWKDFVITLYGTPGQPRFDALMPALLMHAMGVILLIDATRPESLPRARELIGLVREHHVPLVIAANKNDCPGVMTEKTIRQELAAEKDIPLFFLSARDEKDVRHVVETLADSITRYTY